MKCLGRLTQSQDEVIGKKRETEEEALDRSTVKGSFFTPRGKQQNILFTIK